MSITVTIAVFIVIGTRAAEPESPSEARDCGTWEWSCAGDRNQNQNQSRTCIGLNKFCDGVRQCPDGSDEPAGCTNCNRTYSGKMGVKFPLRVTGPVQPYMPFVCQLDFVALGGEFGDLVELTFLSFHIGRLEFTRKLYSACKKGYMTIVDNNTPDRQPDFPGHFCGTISGKTASFFSRTNSTSVRVVVPSSASSSTSSFGLFLAFRFLERAGSPTEEESGVPVPGTACDRVLDGCDLRRCRIRSPNFPGFYPRNVTCSFYVRQMTVPQATMAHLVLSQSDEFKLLIPRGRDSLSPTSSKHTGNSLLSNDCSPGVSDYVTVYDGPTEAAPLLAKFCGSGTMSQIKSSGTQLLVQLHSAPSQLLASSKVEIAVGVTFDPDLSSQMKQDGAECSFTIDARKYKKWGVIHSPRHTMTKNSSCTYNFVGSSPYERIWIYFVSYASKGKSSVNSSSSNAEGCVFDMLELIDAENSWSSRHLNGITNTLRFCGDKIVPKLCSHAMDYPPHYLPERPCKYSRESYFSSGSQYTVRHSFLTSLKAIDELIDSSFVARYEFVDTWQDGAAVDRSPCNRVFDSRVSGAGYFSSPRNLFLFGRGGRSNLKCVFSFVGHHSERVRVTVLKMRLSGGQSESPCSTHFDNAAQRYTCVSTNDQPSRTARIDITEHWLSFTSPVGCLCNQTYSERRTGYVFDSLVSNVDVVFSVTRMTAAEDFGDFSFDARFEFYNFTTCETQTAEIVSAVSREGTIRFQVPDAFETATLRWPLRCRWRIEALTQKYLYVQFRGSDVTRALCDRGLWVLVHLDTHAKPIASACLTPNDETRRKDYDIFSQSWHNDTLSLLSSEFKDQIFIEAIASRESQESVAVFHWLEVTKPFYRTLTGRPLRNIDCQFECPEIGACIDPHLWCDGTAHCPSGYDELSDNCRTFGTGLAYLSMMVVFASVVLVIAMVLIFFAVFKHRRHFVSERRKRIKDSYRLSPTEEYPMASPIS